MDAHLVCMVHDTTPVQLLASARVMRCIAPEHDGRFVAMERNTSRVTRLTNVDLPDPLGPRIAMDSPSSIAKSSTDRMVLPARRTWASRSWSSGALAQPHSLSFSTCMRRFVSRTARPKNAQLQACTAIAAQGRVAPAHRRMQPPLQTPPRRRGSAGISRCVIFPTNGSDLRGSWN